MDTIHGGYSDFIRFMCTHLCVSVCVLFCAVLLHVDDGVLKMQNGIKVKADCVELCECLADRYTCDTNTHVHTHTREDMETERRL